MRVPTVRLIGANGEQLGVVPTERALVQAREQGLDLVELAPNVMPPVCKLVDYGKFIYAQKKQEQKARSAGKQKEMKGIRISPRIGEHDLETKARQADEFLEKKHPVKLELRFRGREITHGDIADKKVEEFLSLLRWGTPEGKARKQGRQLLLIINPSNKPNDEAKISLRSEETHSSDGDRASTSRKTVPQPPAPTEE